MVNDRPAQGNLEKTPLEIVQISNLKSQISKLKSQSES